MTVSFSPQPRADPNRNSQPGSRRAVGVRRLPVIGLAALSLLAGLDAALLLLGLPAPLAWGRLPGAHGTLLVFGFVGTLIALERGIALRHWSGHLAPILFGLGALASIGPLPPVLPRMVTLAGSVALVGTYLPLWRRQRDHAVLVQALGAVLAPDDVMSTIPPGESLVYRFTAERAGIWMFHCSTMPMSAHIANGMFGAVVIEPPGLPEVDRSELLLQSEYYLGPEGQPVDPAKVAAETPDAVVFNGYANQYDHRPLRARVGERIRIWVLDAGPNRSTSFHVVGGQFDTVYVEGAHLLEPGQGGSQALALGPGQGGFVELSFDEPGHYPFVTHVMVDSERGAHGVIEVGP